jgi:endonuclease I
LLTRPTRSTGQTTTVTGRSRTPRPHVSSLPLLGLLAMLGVWLGMLSPHGAFAQTNPTPQPLPYSQTFGTTNFTVLPAGLAGWNGLDGNTISTQTLAELSTPTGNATILSGTPTGATPTGGLYGDGTTGNGRLTVQTSSNSTNGVNQLALAINTTGHAGITLSYRLINVVNNTRAVGCVAQYRIGTSGGWTTLPTVPGNPYVQSGGTVGAATDVTITLPPVCDNRPVVQVRWAVWRQSGSLGSSSGFAIDNISVTSSSGSSGPTITQQPSNLVVTAPLSASFSVQATGVGTLTYQWRRNGVPLTNAGAITGADTATLTLTSTTLSDSGNYDCLVTDSTGTTPTEIATLVVNPAPGSGDPYLPPASYYLGTNGASKSSIRTRISTPYVNQPYDNARFSLQVLDRDPLNPSNIRLIYTGASVPAPWDSGVTWNREHMWPQSRGAGNPPLVGDLHNLRPCNPAVNSSRGNKAYGLPNGAVFWDPDQVAGVNDRGQCARAIFYMDTRWEELTLVDGAPPAELNQMGDRALLVEWHHAQPPTTPERRRNHIIYTSYHLNRNPYIDNPHWVWAIYGTGPNQSTLYLGPTIPASGASSQAVDLGRVIAGTPFPSQNVTLNKAGTTPTYFAVTPSGAAISSLQGPFNAFTSAAGQTRTIIVGLTPPAGPAGENVSGTVTIRNLDLTSAGPGMGSADGDDHITVSGQALARSRGSWTPSTQQLVRTVNLGSADQGGAPVSTSIDLFNLEQTPGLTAGLIVTGVSSTGDTGVLTIDLQPFTTPVLVAGTSRSFTATLTPTGTPGVYTATYTIQVADEPIPGASPGSSLTLTLNGSVTPAGPTPCNSADIAQTDGTPGPDGQVDNGDFSLFISSFFGANCPGCDPFNSSGQPCNPADIAQTDSSPGADGCVDNGDFALFITAFFSAACP